MTPVTSSPSFPGASLLADFSMEITGKDIAALEEASDALPPGTRVNITFLGNEEQDLRIRAARRVRELGLEPVPHLAARRFRSTQELRDFLSKLHDVGATDALFVVGGDPTGTDGPYRDALAIIESGELEKYGVLEVGVAGYPDGHPEIATGALWSDLDAKVSAIARAGMRSTITTQFGFDATPVVKWIREVREIGIDSEVRIGTPGPAGIKRLLGFAGRFGVSANAMIVRKYGFSLTNLIGTAGPDRFITALAHELADTSNAGEVDVHFYSFGGPRATAEWAREFLATKVD